MHPKKRFYAFALPLGNWQIERTKPINACTFFEALERNT